MKAALLTLLVALTCFSAQARNGFGRPGMKSCTAKLEKKFNDFSSNYYFVDSFTEFGSRACLEAEQTCETERFSKWDSWKYRCIVERPTRPVPARSCKYRIEVGGRNNRRFIGAPFVATGFTPCQIAKQECQDELFFMRRQGRVGRKATCVKVSGNVRPTPRPTPRPRLFTESCTAGLVAGRLGRPTGNNFSSTATARSSYEAEQRACDQALADCAPYERGALRCEILN